MNRKWISLWPLVLSAASCGSISSARAETATKRLPGLEMSIIDTASDRTRPIVIYTPLWAERSSEAEVNDGGTYKLKAYWDKSQRRVSVAVFRTDREGQMKLEAEVPYEPNVRMVVGRFKKDERQAEVSVVLQ